MRVVILGAGNLLLSDEGFGVHFVRYLERDYIVPPGVELVDAGTLGLMMMDRVEQADHLYIVDAIDAPGSPRGLQRFSKDQMLRNELPIKLSPHQAGVQEMLLVSELRGRCPADIRFWGVVPVSMAAGTELSAEVKPLLEQLAKLLNAELALLDRGLILIPKAARDGATRPMAIKLAGGGVS